MASDGSPGGGGEDGEVDAEDWTPAERALLDAALDFYGAAEGVIDLSDHAGPQLRGDRAGFDAIRQAMRGLEARVLAAHEGGASAERIASITRIERETIDAILARRAATLGPEEG